MTHTFKPVEHHKLVLPEHMNHQGSLYGGNLLKWIDEVAYISANIHFPSHRFVTVSLDNVEFKHRIECGEIICFNVDLVNRGTTSVSYLVTVKGTRSKSDLVLFETKITFVSVDNHGYKTAIVDFTSDD